MKLGRERLLALAIVGVVLAAVVTIVVDPFAGPSTADRLAETPEFFLDEYDFISLGLRTSLTDVEGETRFTDSAAELDLLNDRSYVDLPDVLRDDSLELVGQGLTLYVTIPQDLSDAFPGIRWLRVDTASRADARGAGVGSVPDPTTVLLSIAGATGEAELLDDATFDGESVEVYRVTVEPRRMADRLGRDHVASANKLGNLSLTWTAEVSVADDGVPRRIVLRTDLTEDGVDQGSLELDLAIGGLDVPVDIGVPDNAAARPVATVLEALQILEAA